MNYTISTWDTWIEWLKEYTNFFDGHGHLPGMQEQFLQESLHLNLDVLCYMDGKFVGAF